MMSSSWVITEGFVCILSVICSCRYQFRKLWFYKYKIELQSEAGKSVGRRQVLLCLHSQRKPSFSKMNISPLRHYFPMHFWKKLRSFSLVKGLSNSNWEKHSYRMRKWSSWTVVTGLSHVRLSSHICCDFFFNIKPVNCIYFSSFHFLWDWNSWKVTR